MFQFTKAIVGNDTFDFSNLARDLTQPGALSLDQIASDPRNSPEVQNEIDYLSRDSRAETDYLNRDAQAEIDYYNEINQTGPDNSSDLWF